MELTKKIRSNIIIFILMFSISYLNIESNKFNTNPNENLVDNLKLNKKMDNYSDLEAITEENILQPENQFDPYITPFDISRKNVSQFNISESITSTSTQTSLIPNDENLTIELPNGGWNLDNHFMNISSIYQDYEIIQDGEILKNPAQTPWDYETTNFVGNFALEGKFVDKALTIKPKIVAEPNPVIPYESYCEWYETIAKPQESLGICETELYHSGKTETPLYSDFETNPNPIWNKNYQNPYGGENGTSTKELVWLESDESLQAYIKAGTSQLSLGNPSICWESQFGWNYNFLPDKVELTISWSVENLGYEAQDNFSIRVRIDNNYLDGRQDIENNEYSNATSTSIEKDFIESEIQSHGVITRTFDITSLLKKNSLNHIIDFGIEMENINETNDEVDVRFHSIEINAVEEDQYVVGTYGFDLKTKFNDTSDMENWLLYSHFENQDQEIYQPIGYIDEIFSNAANETYIKKFINQNLTTRLKNILNSSISTFAVGILNTQNIRNYNDYFEIILDNFSIKPTYAQNDLTEIDLELLNENNQWIDQRSYQFTDYSSFKNNNITLSFRINDEDYENSTMNFKNSIQISKINENQGIASYSIDDIDIINREFIDWNVTYNTTETIEKFITENFWNFNPTRYNWTFIDIPAWDEKGSESEDWKWTGGFCPNGDLISNINVTLTNGTNNSGYLQNITIINNNDLDLENYTIGTWILNFTSINYLSNISLNHLNTESTKFYDQDSTELHVNRSKAYTGEIYGNFNTSVKTPNGILISGFPQYSNNQLDNLTIPWTFQSSELGYFQLISIWNDTDPETLQTKRVGIITSTFEVWRKTNASLLNETNELSPGSLGEFYFNFSQNNGTPISNSENYIDLYVNSTGSKWGLDWAPNQYLVTEISENLTVGSQGNYTLEFDTINIPNGNYSVYIELSKPFYETKILYSWINIAGNSINMEVISGAVNLTEYSGFIPNDNLPFVNDSSTSTIQIYLKNQSIGKEPITDGIVTCTFNGSSNIFYGEEIYQNSLLEEDKGYYDITLDTSGLDTTERSDIYNYTLTITVSVSGFNSTYTKLSTRILAISTQIEASNISPQIEGGNFEFFATYENNLTTPNVGLKNATMRWGLYNSSNDQLCGWGNLIHLMSGVYRTDIELSTSEFYVGPGNYWFEVNGTQENCALATWSQTDLVIIPKESTNLTLTTNSEIKIGEELIIEVNLNYINGIPIENADILISIEFTIGDEILFNESYIRQTNDQGSASYSQMVSSLDESGSSFNISIFSIYFGSQMAKQSSDLIENKFVRGKSSVDILLEVKSEIRVGYSTIIQGMIRIEDLDNYFDISLTTGAWYDGNSNDYIFLQKIFPSVDGSFSFNTPEIADGTSNITFFVDYPETSTTKYQSNTLTKTILEKWDINIGINDFPDSLRIGDSIEFKITAFFTNISCPETFYAKEIRIRFDYSGESVTNTYYFNENNQTLVQYIIPQNIENLNITLIFDGTNQIKSNSRTFSYNILPKWRIDVFIVDIPSSIRIGQSIQFRLNASFVNDSCPLSLYGMNFIITYTFEGGDVIIEKNFGNQDSILIDYIIPQNCGDFLNITVEQVGSDRIESFEETFSFSVQPKWRIEVFIVDIPSSIRIGQSIQFRLNASFENDSCPLSIYGMNFIITYTFEGGDVIIEKIFGNQDSILIDYIIPQNCGDFLNITVEQVGSDRIESFEEIFPFSVLPKFSIELDILNLTESLRQGQELTFSVSANFVESESNLDQSIEGIDIIFILNFGEGNILKSFNGTLNELGKWELSYSIPKTISTSLKISLTTEETSTVGTSQIVQFIEILPQKQTSLILLDSENKEEYKGEFYFKVRLIDSEGKSIEGKTIYFLIKDSETNLILSNTSAITNNEGIVEISILFDEIGSFTIDPVFYGEGIYSDFNLDFDTSFQYNVRVINFGVKILDNISLILMSLGFSIAISAAIYRGVIIPRKRKRKNELMAFYHQLDDVENIQYLLILHKVSGISIFSHSIADLPIDPQLISGFLSAISIFGEEIGNKMKKMNSKNDIRNKNQNGKGINNLTKNFQAKNDLIKGQGLKELTFHKFKIVMVNEEHVRVACLLLKSSSTTLQENLKKFGMEFEKSVLDLAQISDGQISKSEPTIKLLEKYLHIDLLYPLNIVKSKISSINEDNKSKLNSIERFILNEARDTFNNSFYIKKMINIMKAHRFDDLKSFKAINQLREKGIILAINSKLLSLIEEFKPLFESLTKEEQITLIEIIKGVKQTKRLKQHTKITAIMPVLDKLYTNDFIQDDNSLTESGKLVSTLLNIMPEF